MAIRVVDENTYEHSSFLPPGWKLVEPNLYGGLYRGPKGLKVLVSVMNESDNNDWLHVSLSHKDRLPTYEEMKQVKALFVGRDRQAIQVFPPESNHVNVHPYCLHLWCCLSANPLPDFTRGLGVI